MATRASLLSFSPFPSSPLRPRRLHRRQHYLLHSSSHSFSSLRSSSNPTNPRTSFINLTFASLPASFDGVSSDNDNRGSKKSILLNLVQEIEPLDVSIIQKDVPLTTIDAMKRTISGMLGLLPSDQFHVSVEALWEPLSKLFISSMMTGYTLKNAEHRLCLEMIFDVVDEVGPETPNQDDSKVELRENIHHDYGNGVKTSMNNVMLEPGTEKDISPEGTNVQGLGEITPEARQYILHLQSQLSSVKKELHEVKQKSAALQMQQFVGEEKNDLLDYLRSLEPEKVVELSEPTCPELKEAIHSVVHGLLATLSPEMQSKAPPPSPPPECMSIEKVIFEDDEEDRVDIMDNTPLQYQPLISLTRDYLARLIFWCMLFGHYLRDVEYRLELVDLLCVRSNAENGS